MTSKGRGTGLLEEGNSGASILGWLGGLFDCFGISTLYCILTAVYLLAAMAWISSPSISDLMHASNWGFLLNGGVWHN